MAIGIHGPWGDGKTTVLNMLRGELSNNHSIVLRDFNPWRMTDDDALTRGFIAVVSGAIGQSLKTSAERAKEGAGKITGFLRWATKPAAAFSKTAESIDKLLEGFSKAVAAGDSLQLATLRERLIEELKASSVRVVILVDDIDRLDRDETHMLFRLIKACADFPNVCYVLAFDDEAVAKVLAERYGGDGAGRAFLEKIIQIPLLLPVAAREDLRDLCLEEVDRALAAADIRLEQKDIGEFVSSFDRGIAVRLSTPRAAKRFGNALMFTLPLLSGEVNMVDLLLLEGLHAFYPDVYAIVRENHDEFSGVEQSAMRRDAHVPRSSELLDPSIKALSTAHAEAVKAMLKDLFPRLNSVYGGTQYGSDWLEKWSREKRAASPIYCPRYFSYAVPGSDVADSDIERLIALASNGDDPKVTAHLQTLLVGRKARRVIEKLRAIEGTVAPQAAGVLATSLATVGSLLPNPPALFSFAEAPSQAGILISHLLRRQEDRTVRIERVKAVVSVAEPLWFAAECFRWMFVTDKPDQQDKNVVTSHERDEIRRLLVARVKERVKTGATLFSSEVPNLQSLLYEWQVAEGRGPVQEYIESVFRRDSSQVANFLDAMTPRAWASGSAVPRVADLRIDQLNNMELLIDLDVLAEWVKRSCSGDFEHPSYHADNDIPVAQRLAEQFIFCLGKRKEGVASDTA